jgi:hypothetical protein
MAGLTQQVLDGLSKIETKIDKLDERLQKVERQNVKNDEVSKTVEDHEERLRELEKLAPAMRAVIWLAGVLGISIVALIWGLITGSVTLIFVK